MLKNNKHNVLFVTIDSCRYDTAINSHLPFLSSLSKIKKGEAPSSYTLPSHISYFSGILPNLIDGDQYLDGIDQIWRSVNAKVRNKKVAITFDGINIIDYYQKQNYSVVGVGGVSFFKKNKNNILPSLFNNFIHFSKTSKENSLIRSAEESPLINQNIETILQNIHQNQPFFLFINCPETHIPYNCPISQDIDENYIKLISKIYSLDFIKNIDKQHPIILSPEERNIILNQQKNL